MKTIRITKTVHFEMAHALEGHAGPCRNIHGHSYRLQVTVAGPVQDRKGDPQNGMVMDFSKLKEILETCVIRKLDHALLLEQGTALALQITGAASGEKIHLVPYTPTCENMLLVMAEELGRLLPSHLRLHHMLLSETPSSFAEWFAEDNLN